MRIPWVTGLNLPPVVDSLDYCPMRKAVVSIAGRNGKSLSLMHENLARYEMDSRVGYGIAEYLIRTL